MKDFSSSYPKNYCSYPQEATKPLMFILLEEEWMLILVWVTKFVKVQCIKNVNINLVWRKFRLDILIF